MILTADLVSSVCWLICIEVRAIDAVMRCCSYDEEDIFGYVAAKHGKSPQLPELTALIRIEVTAGTPPLSLVVMYLVCNSLHQYIHTYLCTYIVTREEGKKSGKSASLVEIHPTTTDVWLWKVTEQPSPTDCSSGAGESTALRNDGGEQTHALRLLTGRIRAD